MRDYGKVHTTFWSSDTVRSMTEDGRTLALYLLTCSHCTIAGAFRLSDGYASDDLQWTAERVHGALRELFDKGFAVRCEATYWVWIRKHLEWNPPANPNQRKAAAKIADQIPEKCVWRDLFMVECGAAFDRRPPHDANGFETVWERLLTGVANQEQKQEQEQNPPPIQEGHNTSVSIVGGRAA